MYTTRRPNTLPHEPERRPFASACPQPDRRRASHVVSSKHSKKGRACLRQSRPSRQPRNDRQSGELRRWLVPTQRLKNGNPERDRGKRPRAANAWLARGRGVVTADRTRVSCGDSRRGDADRARRAAADRDRPALALTILICDGSRRRRNCDLLARPPGTCILEVGPALAPTRTIRRRCLVDRGRRALVDFPTSVA
jgi:hypothetical protein